MDRMELLKTLKTQKGQLHCTLSAQCWCTKIDHMIDLPDSGQCMSPQELIDYIGDELTVRDYKYLEMLTGKELIQHDDS